MVGPRTDKPADDGTERVAVGENTPDIRMAAPPHDVPEYGRACGGGHDATVADAWLIWIEFPIPRSEFLHDPDRKSSDAASISHSIRGFSGSSSELLLRPVHVDAGVGSPA